MGSNKMHKNQCMSCINLLKRQQKTYTWWKQDDILLAKTNPQIFRKTIADEITNIELAILWLIYWKECLLYFKHYLMHNMHFLFSSVLSLAADAQNA